MLVFQRNNDVFQARALLSPQREIVFDFYLGTGYTPLIRTLLISIVPLGIEVGCASREQGEGCRCSKIHEALQDGTDLPTLVLQICPERRLIPIETPEFVLPFARTDFDTISAEGIPLRDGVSAIRQIALAAICHSQVTPDTVSVGQFVLSLFAEGTLVHFIDDETLIETQKIVNTIEPGTFVPHGVRLN